MFDSKQAIKAVSAVFIFNGALFGAWASRIPAITQAFDMSHQELSVLLLLLAAGAICSFPIAGKLTDSIGASRLSCLTFMIYAAAFALIGVSPNIYMLGLAIFVFGALHGAMDVAMNTWASEVETQSKKAVMPFFHAMFSLGAGIGAASGAIMSSFEIEVTIHFIIFISLFIPCYFWLKNSAYNQAKQGESNGGNANFKFPRGSLLIVAIVAFSCALGEGAMADWTAVFMTQEVNSSHSEAALAYTLFSIFMVLTRLSGTWLLAKLGTKAVVKLCAISSLSGAVIVVSAHTVITSYLGFALLGIGYSIIMPLAFSKAAKIGGNHSGTAIASVATFAYGGMLLGPVILGFLADIISLRMAFLLFAVLSTYVFFAAKNMDSHAA